MKKYKNVSKVLSLVLLVLSLFAVTGCDSEKTSSIKLKSSDDINKLIDSVIKKEGDNLPALNTLNVDLEDSIQLKSFVGISEKDSIEEVIAVEPFISSQPFSLAFIKVADNSNIKEIKKNIFDNMNMRKWICTEADKLYVFNNGNVIIAFMASNDWSDIVYNDIKDYLDNEVGEVLTKNGSDFENME